MIRARQYPVNSTKPTTVHIVVVLIMSTLLGFTINRATAKHGEGCVMDVVFSAREIERVPADPDQWRALYDPENVVLFRTSGSPKSAYDGFYEPRITDIDDDFSLSWVGTP